MSDMSDNKMPKKNYESSNIKKNITILLFIEREGGVHMTSCCWHLQLNHLHGYFAKASVNP